MKLLFLGTGSAFTTGDNFQSNVVLENRSGKKLLIDCGTDIRWSLSRAGLTYKELDGVYISHLHSDHTGGLEWLAFNTYFDPSCKKPFLYISEDLVEPLWNHVLSGGLKSLKDIEVELSTFFNVVKSNTRTIEWDGVDIELIKTVHVAANQQILPSYGLFFKKIFFTTDTQFTPDLLMEFYSRAELIFHDCETTTAQKGVHAHYDELKTLDSSIKCKMWLYHYNPGPLPDPVRDGFKGFVKKGQVFDL